MMPLFGAASFFTPYTLQWNLGVNLLPTPVRIITMQYLGLIFKQISEEIQHHTCDKQIGYDQY